MHTADFDYHRAASVDEALALLAGNPDAKLLAGGHSLIPMMKLRLAQPGAVVDIGRIAALAGVRETDGGIAIGPLTTHAELARNELVAAHCPLLGEAASRIGDPQVRNKGTIGGNVAHADPASDLPAALVALGAVVRMRGADGEREVAASSFFQDLLTTDLGAGEIITSIDVDTIAPGSGSAYLKAEHPASGYAVVGAAAIVTLEGGSVSAATLVFNGVAATPASAHEVAAALVGGGGDDAAIDAAVDEHLAIADPLGDAYASGEYRTALAKAYGKRALKTARDRAR